jgi:hypothetical protein
VTSGGDTAVVHNIIKIIPFIKALLHLIEAKIIRLFQAEQNDSITYFSLKILFLAVRSASKQFTLNLLKNENPVQNEYWLFSGSVFTVLKLKSEKIKRTENEYFIQNESSLFFQNEYIRFMT